MNKVMLDCPNTSTRIRKVRAELIDRAAGLVPLLSRNAKETEVRRRIADENIEAMREAGLFRLLQPTEFGGFETDARTMIDVTAELGRGCGSSAWVAAIYNGGSWLIAARFPRRAQLDVWEGHPEHSTVSVLPPSGQAIRNKGGYWVSGKWPFASGSAHAEWAAVGIPARIDDAGNAVGVGFGLISMAEMTVEDTWHVAGMRGTASNTLVANNIFVPDHRIIDRDLLLHWHPNEKDTRPLYRTAPMSLPILSLVGPLIGVAEAALEYAIEKAPSRSITYSRYLRQTDSPSVHAAIQEAAMLIDSARLHSYRAAADIDAAAVEGVFPEKAIRARIRADGAAAAQFCRKAVGLILSAHGTASMSDSSPLQRYWRDVETGSRHALLNPGIAHEVLGRILLGNCEPVTDVI